MRWIAPLLTGALLASAGVGYAIVRITSPAASADEEPDAVATSSQLVSASSTLESAPPSTVPVTPSTDETAVTIASAEPEVPATRTSDLDGSDVQLPAAWSGTATVTMTALGECDVAAPSVYRDVPADLAMDLVGNEAHAAEIPLDPSIDPDQPTLTLGLNPSAIPSLAVYSSQLDEDGAFHRYWDLQLEPGPNWTEIHGTLVLLPSEGINPNMMVDSETALQPCEAAGSVSLPRALTAGSTIDGWVTRTRAKLTLHAVTADGKRQVDVEIDAQRRQ